MTLDITFALHEQRLRMQLAKPYVGPIRLPVRHRKPAAPRSPDAIRADVLRDLGTVRKEPRAPIVSYCLCGAIKGEESKHCRACAGQLNAGSFSRRQPGQLGPAKGYVQTMCPCGRVMGRQAARCKRCKRNGRCSGPIQPSLLELAS